MSKNKQQDLQQTLKVENYEFEPIKGYPMLNWKGKRPFTSTQYFPAQLKESYGKPDANGWMNKIFWGDNLQVMSHLLKEYRGKVDFVYIDPPFDSKTDYKKRIALKGKDITNDINSFEEKQYSDLWSNDEYLQFIFERVLLLKELLSSTGVIFVHCDWHKSHYIRLIMDEVFGLGNFVNEIIWKRKGGSAGSTNQFGVVTDTILFYKKTDSFDLQLLYTKNSDEAQKYIEERFNRTFNSRKYMVAPIERNAALGLRENLRFEYKGYTPQYGWMMSKEKLIKFDETNRLEWNKNGKPVRRVFLDEYKGQPIENLWSDIYVINPMASERINYPTQKPEQLIERMLRCSTKPGDLVLDCFMGSGTVQNVALKNGRRFVGADINLGAIQTTTKRLNSTIKELGVNKRSIIIESFDGEEVSVEVEPIGFSVYNVNNYELFRNPVEAKELILQALEVSKISNSIYDGEKDGRMVKIMPINRIASKGDLGDLISGFDYKVFEKRQKESPNKAVEKILIVCMGHEPDLKAHLEKEVNYKLDVEIVDILRDKQDLQFKRESEAKVRIKKDKLVIEKFYPMNLLQKLSLQKEKVSDWKELVESVLIDWNYDGAVLEPQVIDIPEKNELVAGVYDVPKDAGTIRVKITDLLSESIEIEVGRE